jgi:hypothetical protein
MATRLHSVVVDSRAPAALADWWSRALGWPVTYRSDSAVVIEPVGDTATLELPVVFARAPEPQRGKDRMHLDLASRSAGHQVETIERLVDMGATHVDVGQRDVAWEVLADPEGHEFCVLPPDTRFDHVGALEAITLDAMRPGPLAGFWAQATGWHVESASHLVASLRHPTGAPPALDIVAVDAPTEGKNRVHLDLAPAPDDDQAAEVDRLVRLGARRADVGQGADASWIVLADPEGNEFCVLTPR